MTLLALRHGWDLPGSQATETVPEENHEAQRIFEPADLMIKRQFAHDSRRIVGRISLPMISVMGVHAPAGQ